MAWSGLSLTTGEALFTNTGRADGVISNRQTLNQFSDTQWGGITIQYERVDGRDFIRVTTAPNSSNFGRYTLSGVGSDWYGSPSVIVENLPEGISFNGGTRIDDSTWSFAIPEINANNAVSLAGISDNYNGTSNVNVYLSSCLLYTSPSPRDGLLSRMPSSA